MKKRTIASWLLLGTAVFAIVACVLGYLSSIQTEKYAVPLWGITSMHTIVPAILCVILFIFAGKLKKNKITIVVTDMLRWIILIMLLYFLNIMISARADLMGYIWFSDLETGNAAAIAALNYAVFAWIADGIALLCTAVGGFFELMKAE